MVCTVRKSRVFVRFFDSEINERSHFFPFPSLHVDRFESKYVAHIMHKSNLTPSQPSSRALENISNARRMTYTIFNVIRFHGRISKSVEEEIEVRGRL
ncbi:hypothetical protein TNIN_151061 [Trichonephila inaurata madagascariensis]|uniref:Uncharacterized protein n=1 Tax=Trichonephila inaurata madagascariensis TaxID=2747483 RepID=A0A8X7C9I1_9ARAC|nr:hypothetical protein TNIN_444191 [Trichonephila inaurata madagascariensis]GFY77504.1 hypothetical protein TNIN_151061 [Trichonephila inaurata madagascariensis]